MTNTLSNWIEIQSNLNIAMDQVRKEIVKQIIDYPNLNPDIANFLIKLNLHNNHNYFLSAFIKRNLHQLKIGDKFTQLPRLEDFATYIGKNSMYFEAPESPNVGSLNIEYNDQYVITNIEFKGD